MLESIAGERISVLTRCIVAASAVVHAIELGDVSSTGGRHTTDIGAVKLGLLEPSVDVVV